VRETCVPQSYTWGVEAQIDWYEAYAVRILQDYFQCSDARFDHPLYRTYLSFRCPAPRLEPPTRIEEYLWYLMDAGPTRKCQNPECAAPYFFAKRRTQRYCSKDCAEPAQRAFKINWWKRKGKQWRANRRAESTATNEGSRQRTHRRSKATKARQSTRI
jgi:hypothetical protein